jgi:hypothetical protein
VNTIRRSGPQPYIGWILGSGRLTDLENYGRLKGSQGYDPMSISHP